MSTVLVPALDTPLCISDLGPRRRESALLEMSRCARSSGAVADAVALHATLLARERFASTSPGRGLALPNVRSVHVVEPRVVLARSRRGIDWGAPDGEPVHVVMLVLSPAESSLETHHGLLTRAYGAVRLARHRQRLLDADDAGITMRALWEIPA